MGTNVREERHLKGCVVGSLLLSLGLRSTLRLLELPKVV